MQILNNRRIWQKSSPHNLTKMHFIAYASQAKAWFSRVCRNVWSCNRERVIRKTPVWVKTECKRHNFFSLFNENYFTSSPLEWVTSCKEFERKWLWPDRDNITTLLRSTWKKERKKERRKKHQESLGWDLNPDCIKYNFRALLLKR